MKNFYKIAAFGLAFSAVPGLAQAAEVSDVRDVGKFSRIVIESSADITVEVGGAQRVEVNADAERIADVTTVVRGDTLYVDQQGRHWRNNHVWLNISVPSLDGAEIDGSGDIVVHGLDSDVFEIEIDGSGDITLDGSCGDLTISVDGSGDIDSRKLKCQTANLEIAGSGDVDVYASEAIELEINGSGDVTVYGDPGRVRPRIHGSGDLDFVDDK